MKFKTWFKDIWETRYKLVIAFILVLASSSAIYYAGSYVTELNNTTRLTDIILDNYGPINLSFIFVWYSLFIAFAFYIYYLVFEPKNLYYALLMVSILYIIRSLFIILTHLQNPFDMIEAHWPPFANIIVYSNDLFFSGHTSFPFMAFLITKNKLIRYFMLFSSIIIGFSALMMHQHYSIDVFAAFFITYGIYKIGDKMINFFENRNKK